MTTYIALLRSVNVGGTGKLPMADLRDICVAAGFERVKTYIASGNALFDSAASAKQVKTELEKRLMNYAGKPVSVFVRTHSEMKTALAKNPFPEAAPYRTVAIFLHDAPSDDALLNIAGVAGEEVQLGLREIYVHYPDGQGVSKLKIPAAKTGTARNMNTIAKLVELAANL